MYCGIGVKDWIRHGQSERKNRMEYKIDGFSFGSTFSVAKFGISLPIAGR
jgi:hypothetical protein